MAGCPVPWWFAGGWAIDLWLGRRTRDHSDLEIGCFRADLPRLLNCFRDWDIQVARNKRLLPYDRTAPPPTPPFSLWLRRSGETMWDLEVLVEERSGDLWHYRRDERVTLPVARLTVPDGNDAWRLIAPEIQLLYKAPALREKDTTDFDAALPHLSGEARRWLAESAYVPSRGHPDHGWLTSSVCAPVTGPGACNRPPHPILTRRASLRLSAARSNETGWSGMRLGGLAARILIVGAAVMLGACVVAIVRTGLGGLSGHGRQRSPGARRQLAMERCRPGRHPERQRHHRERRAGGIALAGLQQCGALRRCRLEFPGRLCRPAQPELSLRRRGRA